MLINDFQIVLNEIYNNEMNRHGYGFYFAYHTDELKQLERINEKGLEGIQSLEDFDYIFQKLDGKYRAMFTDILDHLRFKCTLHDCVNFMKKNKDYLYWTDEKVRSKNQSFQAPEMRNQIQKYKNLEQLLKKIERTGQNAITSLTELNLICEWFNPEIVEKNKNEINQLKQKFHLEESTKKPSELSL